MKPTMKAGIVLGVLVGIWTLLMGYSGWYKDPVLLNVFYVVILIELGVLIWGLRMTAPENTYWKQVGAGTLISVIGAVIIFCVSLIFTNLLFPNYFEELRTIREEMLRQAGQSEDQIAAALEASRSMENPVVNALMGVVGTVGTGFVASLVIALFLRKK